MSIEFGLNFTKISSDWTSFKNYMVLKNKTTALQFEEELYTYNIFFFDNQIVYITMLWKQDVPESVINSGYSQAQNDIDKLDFETNYMGQSNKSLEKKDVTGRPIYVGEPRIGDETIYTTHNFCDKVSWFGDSIRVTNKVLTSSDGYQWSSDDQFWVDMVSGRVQDDDGLVEEQSIFNPEDPHGYQVIINVDGYDKVMREPFENSGGDYEIFWEDGYIKSFDDWTGKTVLANYSKVNGSTFVLRPLPGRYLNIEAAEADFSEDCVMTDTIEYNVYGYASIFAPQLGLPEGTKIPLTSNKYKRLSQILNEAIGAYPKIEVFASTLESRSLSDNEFRRTNRGIKSFVQSIPFRYATVRSLKSSLGLELRVKLSHDREFDGSLGTLTFYCVSGEE